MLALARDITVPPHHNMALRLRRDVLEWPEAVFQAMYSLRCKCSIRSSRGLLELPFGQRTRRLGTTGAAGSAGIH
jgi:hypothetical protein